MEGWLIGVAAIERGRTRKIQRRVLVSSAIFPYHPFSRHVLFFGLLVPFVRSFVHSFVHSFVSQFYHILFSFFPFPIVFHTPPRMENAFQFGHGCSRGRRDAAGDRLSFIGAFDFDSRGQRTPDRFIAIQRPAKKRDSNAPPFP